MAPSCTPAQRNCGNRAASWRCWNASCPSCTRMATKLSFSPRQVHHIFATSLFSWPQNHYLLPGKFPITLPEKLLSYSSKADHKIIIFSQARFMFLISSCCVLQDRSHRSTARMVGETKQWVQADEQAASGTLHQTAYCKPEGKMSF